MEDYKYRLEYIRKKDGIDVIGTASFPNLKWAWKAAKDQMEIEKFRYEANLLPVPKVIKTGRGYKIGNYEIRIIIV